MFRILFFVILLLHVVCNVAWASEQFATSEDCSSMLDPVLGCTNSGPPTPIFTVTYPAGEIQCASSLTIGQAALEPTLSLADSFLDSSKFYTVLLVDTGNSAIHPILHYGASNIVGGDLSPLEPSAVSPFSDYRGPNPPSYVPGIENQLFNYEWIVAEQDSFVENLPSVFGTVMFSYNDYLAGVGATTLSTMYFSSGFCVKEVVQPTVAPKAAKTPKGSKGSKVSKKVKHSKKNANATKANKSAKVWEY